MILRCAGLVSILGIALFAGSPAAVAQSRGEGMLVDGAKGIARFVEKGVDPGSFAPSVALSHPVQASKPVPSDGSIKVEPLFWTSEDGRRCVKIDIDAG